MSTMGTWQRRRRPRREEVTHVTSGDEAQSITRENNAGRRGGLEPKKSGFDTDGDPSPNPPVLYTRL